MVFPVSQRHFIFSLECCVPAGSGDGAPHAGLPSCTSEPLPSPCSAFLWTAPCSPRPRWACFGAQDLCYPPIRPQAHRQEAAGELLRAPGRAALQPRV